MDDRQAYIGDLRAKLAQWDARRERLRDQVRRSDAAQRDEFERRMASADMRRRSLEQQIADAEKRPQSAWEDFKEGIERAWGELGQALDDTVDVEGASRQRNEKAPPERG